MPKKKSGSAGTALATVAQQARNIVMNGGTEAVRVDAVYRVPAIHPYGDGPWRDEADKIAWTDPMSGYACIIRRSPTKGHLCGYVAVPPTHPLFGMRPAAFGGLGVRVHGGVTYSGECQRGEPESRSICHVSLHVPANQEVYANAAAERAGHDDAWWFGFECNQAGDVVPQSREPFDENLHGVNERSYKTEQFVYDECVRLAVQLRAVEDGRDARAVDPGPSVHAYDPMKVLR